MAELTPDQLTAATTAATNDLVLIFPLPAGPLKKMEYGVFLGLVTASLKGSFLTPLSNLADVQNPGVARTNLGLGTAALLSSAAVFQVSNNLSEVANAATARMNIGAAASSAPTITSGMDVSGSVKQNVLALAGTDINVSQAEMFTKSISSNATLTFSGATASKGMGFVLELTISGGAVPTWPASVDWSYGSTPTFGNGKHIIGFLTFNGGTDWTGSIFATVAA